MKVVEGSEGISSNSYGKANGLSRLFQRLRKSHVFWMVLLCLLPIAFIAAGGYYTGWGTNGWISLVFFALCGLSHIFMMSGHGKDKEGHKH
ncbi:MAG: hypothetical protein QS98_C0004G0002 [archaeon GW2011_AR3]|nr:MAG: hypothetical protein QS98_C0004G0002 [archaeon GW2011_AR3]MBS3109555.1 DUF2933 domain-containing protein [Candidatus Woesearchaeota archaeon]